MKRLAGNTMSLAIKHRHLAIAVWLLASPLGTSLSAAPSVEIEVAMEQGEFEGGFGEPGIQALEAGSSLAR